MKKFYNYINDKTIFFSKLTDLESKTKNEYLLQDIKLDVAKYYF